MEEDEGWRGGGGGREERWKRELGGKNERWIVSYLFFRNATICSLEMQEWVCNGVGYLMNC